MVWRGRARRGVVGRFGVDGRLEGLYGGGAEADTGLGLTSLVCESENQNYDTNSYLMEPSTNFG